MNDEFKPDLTKNYNRSGVVFNEFFHRNIYLNKRFKSFIGNFLSKKHKKKINSFLKKSLLKKPVMKKETISYLSNYFEEDIIKLDGLISQDLDFWLK